jgi:hypothetical protein
MITLKTWAIWFRSHVFRDLPAGVPPGNPPPQLRLVFPSRTHVFRDLPSGNSSKQPTPLASASFSANAPCFSGPSSSKPLFSFFTEELLVVSSVCSLSDHEELSLIFGTSTSSEPFLGLRPPFFETGRLLVPSGMLSWLIHHRSKEHLRSRHRV